MKPTTGVLGDCAECFGLARRNLLEGAQKLHAIEAGKLWEGSHDSFGAFVEDECGISKSFAAKLISIVGYYIEKNQLEPKRLEGIDAEKLYLAIRLPGTVEGQLVKAETWDRQEIRSELSMKDDGTEHEHIPIEICSKCGKRL